MISDREFDALAERILHSLIRGGRKELDEESLGQAAVRCADDFVYRCRQRHLIRRQYDGVLEDELDLILAGQKIKAIKVIRKRSGMGLKEAKKLVDQVAERHGV